MSENRSYLLSEPYTSPVTPGITESPPNLLSAAVAYASAGYPVFPLHELDELHRCSCGKPGCEHGGKHPRVSRGFHAATTDTAQVLRWWRKWPNGNIGIRTGAASGLLVIDVDDLTGLDELEARIGKLPATLTASTGSGGLHLYFRYPNVEIRNSAGKLTRGVDVRGEGGYIVAPPSRTMRPYAILDKLPQAEPPGALVAALEEDSRGAGGLEKRPRRRINPGSSVAVVGGPIGAGARNDSLTRIVGRLHDGVRDLDELVAALDEVNRARCAPPLELDEVQRIASSIFKRPPCKPGAPTITAETLAMVDAYDAAVESADWPGMGGKTDRDVLVMLIDEARKVGTMIPAGVRVSISYRDGAPRASTSKKTFQKSVGRLRADGWITRDDGDRGTTEAGAFVLLRKRARGVHTPTARLLRTTEKPRVHPLRAPRLRWSAPEIKRLGKTRGQLVDALDRFGPLRLDELAERTGHKRPRDLRRRVLPDLEAAGVVRVSGDTVSLEPDWLDALNRDRERAGEIAADERDRARYEREREAFRRRREIRTSDHPANRGEMPPAGEIRELRPAPAPDPQIVAALASFLDRNPHRLDELPSWLSVALWSDELLPEKPPPEAVAVALDELRAAA